MHSIFPRAGQGGILGVFGPQTTRQKGLRPSDNFLLRLFDLESLKTTSRYLSSRHSYYEQDKDHWEPQTRLLTVH